MLNAISNFLVDTLDKYLSDAHAPVCIKLQIDNSIITSDLLAKSNALQTNLLNEKVKKPFSKYGSDNCIRYRSKWMSEYIDIYRDSLSNDELCELNEKMHALLDNEVSQPELNKITAALCNLLYTSGKKAGVCKEF